MEIRTNLLTVAKSVDSDSFINKHDFTSLYWKDIFTDANKMRVSDIHIKRMSESILVQFRYLGELIDHNIIEKEKSILETYINRLKEIAGFDLSSKDIAQDKAFTLNSLNTRYRGVISPTMHGEYIVFRIIRDEEIPSIDKLNMDEQTVEDFKSALNQKQGCILITGPTGSGKSNTLQAGVMYMDRVKKNIITIEDPIERLIPRVNQQQISKQLNWVQAIKTAMRQDPDIILIGEIRDKESATLALEAAQTGHLVLSTIHTNDTSGVIDRLVGLGVEKRLIADNLIFTTAQRLLPVLCENCRVPTGDLFTRGSGCDVCGKGMGVNGRVPIVEYTKKPNRETVINFNRDEYRKTNLVKSLYSEIEKEVIKGRIDHKELECWRDYK